MRKLKAFCAVLLILIMSLPITCYADDEVKYSTIEDAACYLRDEMVERNENVVLVVNMEYDQSLMGQILDAATSGELMKDSDTGDYLNESYRNCRMTSAIRGDETQITYEIEYRTTAEQERELNSKVSSVLNSLSLGSSSYSKVKAIYDYLCKNIDYDYSNKALSHTAYGAMMNKTAVCQGYTTLFYKMCTEAGVDVRIMNGDDHSWNIVKIDGKWYHLDSTWDAVNWGKSKYGEWFLKAKLKDHPLDDYSQNIVNGLNMATSDYTPPSSPKSSASSKTTKAQKQTTTQTTTQPPETTTETATQITTTAPSTTVQSTEKAEPEKSNQNIPAIVIPTITVVAIAVILVSYYCHKKKSETKDADIEHSEEIKEKFSDKLDDTIEEVDWKTV